MTSPIVAVQVPPRRLLAALSAQWEQGAAVLPLAWPPPTSAADRAAHDRLLDVTRPARVVHGDADDDRVVARETSDGVPDGTALVMATSGSTGMPKAVVISHEALRSGVEASVQRLGARSGEVFVCALPVHHIGGLLVLLRAARSGTEAQIIDPGDTGALVRAEGDHVSLVPTQLRRLLESAPQSLRSWRSVLVGGGPAESGMLETARSVGTPLICSYGMTETCGGCVYDGLPFDGVELTIGDDGRIRLRGPTLFTGYLDDLRNGRSSCDSQGWFATGDVGRLDADGRLEVLGRIDDIIVTGGRNVPAAPLSEVLRHHPSVHDATVLPWPDPEWGQIVVAVCVPTELSNLDLDDLRAHVRRSLPAWHAPQHLILTDAIPRTPLGKPDRTRLAELAVQALGRG